MTITNEAKPMLRKLYLKWLVERHSTAFKLGYEAGIYRGQQISRQNEVNRQARVLIDRMAAAQNTEDKS
jgi:S-adenosylmethionine:diacylglycerol 3-amino-3-carboxypropyl transferase